jgi:hypothetical protein
MWDVFIPTLSSLHLLWSGDAMEITGSDVTLISVGSWIEDETVAMRTGETACPILSLTDLASAAGWLGR